MKLGTTNHTSEMELYARIECSDWITLKFSFCFFWSASSVLTTHIEAKLTRCSDLSYPCVGGVIGIEIDHLITIIGIVWVQCSAVQCCDSVVLSDVQVQCFRGFPPITSEIYIKFGVSSGNEILGHGVPPLHFIIKFQFLRRDKKLQDLRNDSFFPSLSFPFLHSNLNAFGKILYGSYLSLLAIKCDRCSSIFWEHVLII